MIVAVCVCPTCGAEPIGAEINPSSKAVCPAGHAFDAASPLDGDALIAVLRREGFTDAEIVERLNANREL